MPGLIPNRHGQQVRAQVVIGVAEAVAGRVGQGEHPRGATTTPTSDAGPLATLDQAAYAGSKARHRAIAVAWALDHLEPEIGGLPTRETR